MMARDRRLHVPGSSPPSGLLHGYVAFAAYDVLASAREVGLDADYTEGGRDRTAPPAADRAPSGRAHL